MKEQLEKIIVEIQDLKSRQIKRYPESLKEKVISLLTEYKVKEISEATGLSQSGILKWVYKRKILKSSGNYSGEFKEIGRVPLQILDSFKTSGEMISISATGSGGVQISVSIPAGIASTEVMRGIMQGLLQGGESR